MARRSAEPAYLIALRDALANGYTVDVETGVIRGPSGAALSVRQGNPKAYPTVTIYSKASRRRYPIACHKIVAFAKFGDKAFKRGVQVRHVRADLANFRGDNLILGTPTQNAFDKPPELRREMARRARAAQGPGAWNRSFTDEQTRDIRKLVRDPGDGAALARLLNVHRTTVGRIAAGKRYGGNP